MKMETAILLLLSIRIKGVSHPPVRVLRLQGGVQAGLYTKQSRT